MSKVTPLISRTGTPASAPPTAPTCSSGGDTGDHSSHTQMPSSSSLLSDVGVYSAPSGTTNTHTQLVNQGRMLVNESTGPAQCKRPRSMAAMQKGRPGVTRNFHFSQENTKNSIF